MTLIEQLRYKVATPSLTAPSTGRCQASFVAVLVAAAHIQQQVHTNRQKLQTIQLQGPQLTVKIAVIS